MFDPTDPNAEWCLFKETVSQLNAAVQQCRVAQETGLFGTPECVLAQQLLDQVLTSPPLETIDEMEPDPPGSGKKGDSEPEVNIPEKKEEVISVKSPEPFRFDIYPNPSSGNVTVNINLQTEQGDLQIFDMLGQSVYSQSINKTQTLILNRADFDAGVYMCILRDGNHVMANKKLVFIK